MFNGWKITNILDVGLCELDTADGPYNKTGYRLEHRRDGFAVTVGLMEHITGGYLIASIGFLNKGNHSFLFINPQISSNDPRILGVFLNDRCGYRVVSGEELFSASSVGGPGNSESKFGVYSPGAVIASATYKMRDGENFWVLNAVNGWEFIGKDAVLADDEITEL